MKRVWIILALMQLSAGGRSFAADNGVDEEYKIKAGFVYNFAQFVDWPSSSFSDKDAPLIIGVFGSNPFGAHLKAMENRKVKGHPIQIVLISESSKDIPFCHVLFIPTTQKEHCPDLVDRVRDRPVLTVGECEDFVQRGGIINLYVQNQRIAFEINVTNAWQRKMEISSKLLKLATTVVGGKP